MGKRSSVTPTASQQHPQDCSAAASDTGYAESSVMLMFPKRWPCFQGPWGTSGCFTPRSWPCMTAIGDCLIWANFISPQGLFHLAEAKKSAICDRKFPSCRVDNKPLDRQCWLFRPWTTVATAVCKPQTKIPLFKFSSWNGFFLYYDQCTKKQFKGLCIAIPLTQALLKN